MILRLFSVKIHNFMSYGDATVKLDDRGFCSISGINKNPNDNAKSNGSGKSSLVSAICWALTGETVSGLKTNVANIYLNAGCYVELLFEADGHNYKVTRYREDPVLKTDLKIIVDGEDKSGKGIKESQSILESLLPDLTGNVIRSVIILGQGLPGKFTNNTPAGRKEVLERLSKSDFMIEDIKSRLGQRAIKLSTDLRSAEDKILQENTKLQLNNSNKLREQSKLTELNKPTDYESKLKDKESELNAEKDIQTANQKQIDELNKEHEKLQAELKPLYEERTNKYNELSKQLSDKRKQMFEPLAKMYGREDSLNAEIRRKDNIKDVCPTCGQKLVGVVKPDSTADKKELAELQVKMREIEKQIQQFDLDTDKQLQDLEKLYSDKCKVYNDKLDEITRNITKVNSANRTNETKIKNIETEIIKIKYERDNHNKELTSCKEHLAQIDADIVLNNKNIETFTKEKETVQQHIDVIDKMNTLVKRDFRGFLLKNVIEFISKKAKEYSQEVFGTDKLEFRLEGNNIDITYCDKDFSALSGGEQQRVDIIIQLALRAMMCKYLNFSCNLVFMDEVFDGLDITSCNSVVNLISKKLADLESIFVISHHENLQLPVDNCIIIMKDSRGISTIHG